MTGRSRSGRRSGFPPEVCEAIDARARRRCERCGTSRPPFHRHHRLPRRMGSSADPRVNSAENGLLLCVPCHDWVHAHPVAARAGGWLLQQVADIGQVGVVAWDGGAKVDVAGEGDGRRTPAVEVPELLNGAPLLLGDHLDQGGLYLSEVSETIEGVGDSVEEGGDGRGQ